MCQIGGLPVLWSNLAVTYRLTDTRSYRVCNLTRSTNRVRESVTLELWKSGTLVLPNLQSL